MVSDVLFLLPDDLLPWHAKKKLTTVYHNELFPPLSQSGRGTGEYRGDFCNQEFLRKLSVTSDGDLALPSGRKYKALILPEADGVSQESIRVVDALEAAGALIIRPEGASPKRNAISYKRYDELKNLLVKYQVQPDFEYRMLSGESKISFIHRTTPEAEIYFLASSSREPCVAEAWFRVKEGIPQKWDPMTGALVGLPLYIQEDGRTRIPLHFDDSGSVFIVFLKNAAAPQFNTLSLDGQTLYPRSSETNLIPEILMINNTLTLKGGIPGQLYTLRSASGFQQTIVSPAEELISVCGPWTLSFDLAGIEDRAISRLESWTESDDPNIEAFSGAATYQTEFMLPPSAVCSDSVWLDLGALKNIAEVSVNAGPFQVLWKPPFTLDISPWVHPGENRLTVKVSNLWNNRILADLRLPKNERVAQTTFFDFIDRPTVEKAYPPLPSGLFGPVQIKTYIKRR
jgi:hypothetical protein